MRPTSFARALYELLSSMRLAVCLLSIVAIAAIIGTVLQQNQPYPNYAIEFGEFWFKPFLWLGLYDVYHAAWFLAILGFLLISTSLCIYRQTPGVIRDVQQYREQAAHKSLKAMRHVAQWPGQHELQPLEAHLRAQGYRFKKVARAEGELIAAKKGSAQRLGYLCAHAAIVIICLGGLLDGNVPLKVQSWLGNKQVETRDLLLSEVPPQSRLAGSNPSFRGVMELPEGGGGELVQLQAGDGYYVQELPFRIDLKKFHIEHYSSGQPKLFASDIMVTDKTSGKVIEATVKVNHPLVVDGIAIYQSSFGDGGSQLQFARWDWFTGNTRASPMEARSRSQQPDGESVLEFGDFRAFNIENLSPPPADVGLGKMLQDARTVKADKKVKNLGPSIQFKIRDGSGQAREYLNYFSPIESEGRYYLMSGVRAQLADPFAFIRLPLDADFKVDGFMRFKGLLLDKTQWPIIAAQMGADAQASGSISAAYRKEFEQSLQWVLQRFAEGGFVALDQFLKGRVPEDKRSTVAQTYIKLLQGAAVTADAMASQRAGLPPLQMNETHYRFLMDSLVAISASFDYGAPFYLQPTGFSEVKASGFQLTRSPGQAWVYGGSLLLVLGIFCMFYIRDQRIWIWARHDGLLLAMSANRQDAQLEQEFTLHRHAISQLASAGSTKATP